MAKKVGQVSFSGKSKKKLMPAFKPPVKLPNLAKRSREYLSLSEVKRLIKTAKSLGRQGERDSLMILLTYRHALRVGELVSLRWDQMDLNRGRMHVNRLKNGDPSVHYLEGDEIRALRKLRRDYADSDFVFVPERQGPLTDSAIRKMVARAGIEAKLELSVHPQFSDTVRSISSPTKASIRGLYKPTWGIKTSSIRFLYTQINSKRFKGFGRDAKL